MAEDLELVGERGALHSRALLELPRGPGLVLLEQHQHVKSTRVGEGTKEFGGSVNRVHGAL